MKGDVWRRQEASEVRELICCQLESCERAATTEESKGHSTVEIIAAVMSR